ncbi:hypothetical protein ACFQ2B_34715 [Streptomyces stramineus]
MRDTSGTRTSSKRAGSRLPRLSLVITLSASALLSVVGPAQAAPAKDPLPADIPDYQAALNAVKSADVRNAVCRFLRTPVPAAAPAGWCRRSPKRQSRARGSRRSRSRTRWH